MTVPLSPFNLAVGLPPQWSQTPLPASPLSDGRGLSVEKAFLG